MDTQVNVSKWNPFKFLRKSPDEKRSESTRTDDTKMSSLPAGGLMPLPLLFADPFRAMQSFLLDPVGGNGKLDSWFGDFSPSAFRPRIDVVEDNDAIRITAELPGMDRDDLHVAVEDDALVLRGEKKLESKQDEKGCYRIERAFGRFERVVPLPDGLDLDSAEATFDKGVLTIRVPKSKASADNPAAREIKIN
jgi:HSP20 family protein